MRPSRDTLTPSRFAPQIEAALAYLESGDTQAAEDVLRAITDTGGADAAVYVIRGHTLMRLGDADTGLQMFYQATVRAPTHPPYWYTYGGALLQAKEANAAFKVFSYIVR